MGSDLAIGLQLSAIGLSVTFLALGLLIAVMLILLRIFPGKNSAKQIQAAEKSELDDEQRLEEMAVALAVGISLLEREGGMVQRDPSLGKLLEEK